MMKRCGIEAITIYNGNLLSTAMLRKKAYLLESICDLIDQAQVPPYGVPVC